jgi:hypothetical protein
MIDLYPKAVYLSDCNFKTRGSVMMVEGIAIESTTLTYKLFGAEKPTDFEPPINNMGFALNNKWLLSFKLPDKPKFKLPLLLVVILFAIFVV